jgi:hypothetical protein
MFITKVLNTFFKTTKTYPTTYILNLNTVKFIAPFYKNNNPHLIRDRMKIMFIDDSTTLIEYDNINDMRNDIERLLMVRENNNSMEQMISHLKMCEGENRLK